MGLNFNFASSLLGIAKRVSKTAIFQQALQETVQGIGGLILSRIGQPDELQKIGQQLQSPAGAQALIGAAAKGTGAVEKGIIEKEILHDPNAQPVDESSRA